MPRRFVTTLALAIACVLAIAGESSGQSISVKKKTGYAPVNGLSMYYEIVGEGKPAVFIHPVGSQSALIPRLTTNRQWIIMDLQGHGRTADVDRPMTCEQHADDVAALLKHLRIDQADFFGDSFGGTIAVMMAVRHPKLVRRVVSYGSPLVPIPREVATLVTYDSKHVKWERDEYLKVAPDPKKWPTVFSKALSCGIEWKGFSLDQLKAIKTPVLIACGDRDLIPVERCAELSRIIPSAQLAVIPDASHFVLFSEPERFLPTVATFLDASTNKPPLSTIDSGFYPGLSR